MKNVLVSILSVVVAILIGSFFMEVSNVEEQLEPTINLSSPVKAFQIGAFTNVEAANIEASAKEGIVIDDGEYYYVYIAILSDENNLERMRDYLDNQNIYYYIKTIDTTEEFKNNLVSYEELMKESSSDIAFLQLNARILDMYEGEYEN